MAQRLRDALAVLRPPLVDVAQQLYDRPELPMEEHRSSALVAEHLRDHGFAVRSVEGMPTAFVADAGTSGPRFALPIEYDALAGFGGGVGHACGHHLMAAASLGAVLLLAPIADELGVRVRAVGTPGEEGRGGKALLMESGAFDGVHAALMVHAADVHRIEMPSLATVVVDFRFGGTPAHGAAAPWLGRNALDAANLLYAAIAAARQQLPPSTVVNAQVRSTGATNVITERAEVSLMLRHPDLSELKATIEPWVRDMARGAALQAQVSVVEAHRSPLYAATNSSPWLASCYRAAARAILGVEVSDAGPADPVASTDFWNLTGGRSPVPGAPDAPAIPGIHPLFDVIRSDKGCSIAIHSEEMLRRTDPSAAPVPEVIGDMALVLATAVVEAAAVGGEALDGPGWSVADAVARAEERPWCLPAAGWSEPRLLHRSPMTSDATLARLMAP